MRIDNEILSQVKEVLELQAGLLRELSRLIDRLAASGSELTEERLLPVRKAAERLGVAESTLRRLIAQGEIGPGRWEERWSCPSPRSGASRREKDKTNFISENGS